MSSHRIAKARLMKSEILTAMDANDRITERDKIVIRRVLDGESYRSVAKDFDIGLERVRFICFWAFRERLGFNV
jgi:FixJ family two-component response regulator